MALHNLQNENCLLSLGPVSVLMKLCIFFIANLDCTIQYKNAMSMSKSITVIRAIITTVLNATIKPLACDFKKLLTFYKG